MRRPAPRASCHEAWLGDPHAAGAGPSGPSGPPGGLAPGQRPVPRDEVAARVQSMLSDALYSGDAGQARVRGALEDGALERMLHPEVARDWGKPRSDFSAGLVLPSSALTSAMERHAQAIADALPESIRHDVRFLDQNHAKMHRAIDVRGPLAPPLPPPAHACARRGGRGVL